MSGERVSAMGAVLANGFAQNELDIYDGYRRVKGHPGAAFLPALLAALELKGGCTGAEFLVALVVGYVIGIRAGLIRHAVYPTYHSSGSWGAVAVAACTGRLSQDGKGEPLEAERSREGQGAYLCGCGRFDPGSLCQGSSQPGVDRAGMDAVGECMENEEMFIPEVLMTAKSMDAAVDVLKPLLAESDVASKGKVIIGTVKGDLHDIGKNLVAIMLESAGLEVYNLGVDVAPDKFVNEIKAKNANILALSALLTTTMPMMRDLN